MALELSSPSPSNLKTEKNNGTADYEDVSPPLALAVSSSSSSSMSRDYDADDDSAEQEEESLSVMIASSSSSGGSAIADSWEQADAVVETILLSHDASHRSSHPYQQLQSEKKRNKKQRRQSSSSSGPLSWFCGPLHFLPTCDADPPACAPSSRAVAPVAPIVALLAHPCGRPSHPLTPARQWNGHLPLDPVPEFYYMYPCLRDKRKHRIPALIPDVTDLEDECDFETALFAPSLSIDDEALLVCIVSSYRCYYLSFVVCFSGLFGLHPVHPRPLYVNPPTYQQYNNIISHSHSTL